MNDAPETTDLPTTPDQADNTAEAWATAETSPEPAPASVEETEEPQPELQPDDPPPAFWSVERKALWSRVTDPEVRAAIRGHVEDASRAISAKMEEAARARRAAEETIAAEHRNRDQLAAWWRHNGPAIQSLVQGRWAGVDWNKLAADNPAEYVRLKALKDRDDTSFREIAERHDAEVQAAAQRTKEAHERERVAEHAKLASSLPAEFGDGKAQATYDTLSKYLLDQGISGERISNIYEESIVKIVLKAYKYDQLQAKAKEVTSPRSPAQGATTTPTRIAPGAAQRSANPEGEAKRQAIQALKSGKRLTAEEAALAFS
jgi:hypothetical protein